MTDSASDDFSDRGVPLVYTNLIGVCDDDDDEIDDFNNTGVPIVQFLQDVSQN